MSISKWLQLTPHFFFVCVCVFFCFLLLFFFFKYVCGFSEIHNPIIRGIVKEEYLVIIMG